MKVSALPSNSFLNEVCVYDVDESGHLVGAIGAPFEKVANEAIETGMAQVSTDPQSLTPEGAAAIAIPVYREHRVVSVALMCCKRLDDSHDDLVGVFEVWEPVGIYDELGLKRGYYGRMERFQNVSSFVRFEKGNGLPGQAWQQCSGVIHDDLSNHPGFLRAAGASADLLKTAFAVPVASESFHCTAVLISSSVSPIATAMEVWQAEDDGFSLLGGAYADSGLELEPGSKHDHDSGLAGLAKANGGAVLSDDVDRLMAGRPTDPTQTPVAGLAIPFFDGDVLTSVSSLLF